MKSPRKPDARSRLRFETPAGERVRPPQEHERAMRLAEQKRARRAETAAKRKP